jgi:hypothetical protein
LFDSFGVVDTRNNPVNKEFKDNICGFSAKKEIIYQ